MKKQVDELTNAKIKDLESKLESKIEEITSNMINNLGQHLDGEGEFIDYGDEGMEEEAEDLMFSEEESKGNKTPSN